MGLFGRDPEPGKQPASAPPRDSGATAARQTTLVAPGSKITGAITGAADVVVEGELDGDLDLQNTAHIGVHGRVTGNVSARVVRIAGQVAGEVRGGERVEILGTGQLEGDVSAPRVVIAEGAFVKGKIEMTGQKPAVAGQQPAVSAT